MTRFNGAVRRITATLAQSARRPRYALGATLAVVAACGAITAAAALVGETPTANVGSSSVQEIGTSTTTTSTDTQTQASTASSTVASSNTPQPAGNSLVVQADATDTSTATATATDTSTAIAATSADPHSNGHGCDDIIHAAAFTPGPGGPVGCTVGNSGDHRQNGVTSTATPTPTDTTTATSTTTATDTTTASTATAESDPHANGHGCDDVNPADLGQGASPGGPVGCTVGNSGDHRQNGTNAATPTMTTTTAAAPAAAGTPAVTTTGATGSGNHGHGKK